MMQTSRSSRRYLVAEVTCPHCWHRFVPEDAVWVASHPDLFGDAKLGDSEKMRFLPSRFDPAGEAIDPRGYTTSSTACPHCHLVVPRHLFTQPTFFCSILGAPASGKSYFLASMTWTLRQLLPSDFQLKMTDCDASLNARILEYEEQQFLPADPDALVWIAKTEEQGGMYNRIRLDEHGITLPKPFLFDLKTREKHPRFFDAKPLSRTICLYDNAGESFLPGSDESSGPVTGHLGRSECLIFCFDPTQDPRFRAACQGVSTDPQMRKRSVRDARETRVRQDTILTEAIRRARRNAGLRADDTLDGILVVAVTKWDAWKSLLPDVSQEPPYRILEGQHSASLDVGRIEDVSARLEALLRKQCPEMVAAAESIAKHVVFLPVSASGVSPELDPASGQLGIRPRDLRPQWVEVPLLYALHLRTRGLVQGHTRRVDHSGQTRQASNETGQASNHTGQASNHTGQASNHTGQASNQVGNTE
ncbi:MAG: hypothetical protein AAF958_18525 [Planctomycetota bacterium]